MSFWVSLVSPDYEDLHTPKFHHREIDTMNMNVSYNYSNMMSHLPCDRVRNWQGKQAKDLIQPVVESLYELEYRPNKYRKYEIEPERGLGTISTCIDILHDALQMLERNPRGIVIVD